jgi:hypothetical protein
VEAALGQVDERPDPRRERTVVGQKLELSFQDVINLVFSVVYVRWQTRSRTLRSMAVATMRRSAGVDGPAVALPNRLELAASPQAWHSSSPAVEPGSMREGERHGHEQAAAYNTTDP